jgi:hypothetical protein
MKEKKEQIKALKVAFSRIDLTTTEAEILAYLQSYDDKQFELRHQK